jgi:hypothetical protein
VRTRTLSLTLAAWLLAGPMLFVCMPGASAASSDEASARAKREARQEQRKSERKQRKAERDSRRDSGDGFLKRLWPFGKKEQEERSFLQDSRFGTGNPRDTSVKKGQRSTALNRPLVERKVVTHRKSERKGMQYTRQAPKKRSVSRSHASPGRASEKRLSQPQHSHKNGQYRKATHKQRHRPTGLNWNLPKQKKVSTKSFSHKNGQYRAK